MKSYAQRFWLILWRPDGGNQGQYLNQRCEGGRCKRESCESGIGESESYRNEWSEIWRDGAGLALGRWKDSLSSLHYGSDNGNRRIKNSKK